MSAKDITPPALALASLFFFSSRDFSCLDDRHNNPIFLPEQDRITNLSCIYERDTAGNLTKTCPDLRQGLKIADDVQLDEEEELAECFRDCCRTMSRGPPLDQQTYDVRVISLRWGIKGVHEEIHILNYYFTCSTKKRK